MSTEPRIYQHGLVLRGKFYFPYYFYIKVPEDYDHKSQLRLLREFCNIPDPRLADERFQNVTDRLVPGEEYGIKIFYLFEYVTLQECLDFIKSQKNTVLVGAQGIAFLTTNHLKSLPIGGITFSPDNEWSLSTNNDGKQEIFGIYKLMGGPTAFAVANSTPLILPPNHCMVCFERGAHPVRF